MARRAFAEFLGTALLVAIVVGSGVMAARLSPNDVGLELLENSTATAFGLAVLILIFGPVSGAHFNPVVTLADRVLNRHDGARGIDAKTVAAYLPAQIAGGIGGAILANLMFDLPAATASTHVRASGHLWLGETVATAGLVLLIFSLVRTGRAALAAPAVGAYIGAAYWFTSSTSFANPAVTIARAFTDTFAGIAPGSVAGFVGFQLLGAVIGIGLVTVLYPTERHSLMSDKASDQPSVLFVCVHNAGRSQMAAGFLTHLAGDRVVVRSAGSAPADAVNPAVLEAMAEVGIDLSAEAPKVLTDEAALASDVIITMGCGDTCPVFPGKRYLDWPLPDPAGQGVAAVRPIRDEIERLVQGLIEEIAPAADRRLS
ncbi:aquaporin [Catenulispora yoronensis]